MLDQLPTIAALELRADVGNVPALALPAKNSARENEILCNDFLDSARRTLAGLLPLADPDRIASLIAGEQAKIDQHQAQIWYYQEIHAKAPDLIRNAQQRIAEVEATIQSIQDSKPQRQPRLSEMSKADKIAYLREQLALAESAM